ncbi:enoyl-CoA hydratase [Rothia mucilaginosa]|uniref:enoyl-CoA hydratase n=1 Tax=Rothia mucilaginosa TaxID=43675 RepID=UPI000A7BBC12|nr:enoyl-CoA hydratase [Rothia mucilaginosa]
MAVDTVADPTPSLHDVAGAGDSDDPITQRREGESNVDFDGPNEGDINLTIHRENGAALLVWSGFPQGISAESVLVEVTSCTSTEECTHRFVSPTEGGSPGEVALLLDLPAEGTFYVITLTDAAYGITRVDFLTRDRDTLVEVPSDPRYSTQSGVTPPHGEDASSKGPSATDSTPVEKKDTPESPSPQPSPTHIPSTVAPTPQPVVTQSPNVTKEPEHIQLISSEKIEAQASRQNHRDSPRLTIQNSQVNSSDSVKPVTVRGKNFATNDNGYDLMLMELDGDGHTVGDALAIVRVNPSDLSSGSFEAVLGVPGASLQTGRTYLVVAIDATSGGDVQVSTVRFTVSRGSNNTGNSQGESDDTSTDDSSDSSSSAVAGTSSAAPSTASSGEEQNAVKVADGNKTKIRGVRSATALAGDRKDPTISVEEGTEAVARPAASSSSALGYRTRDAQDEQATARTSAPAETEPATQSRRSSTLDGSSSQVRSEQKGRDGVKASEADLAHGMMASSSALAVLLAIGGGMVLGALGMSRMHASKKD